MELSKLDKTRVALAIALGDPAGIGMEVTLKALGNPAVTERCSVTLVGDRTLLDHTYAQLVARQPHLEATLAHPDTLSVVEVPVTETQRQQVLLGYGNAASGDISFRSLQTAIAVAQSGQVQGVVTAPIAKSAWHTAGHFYPGQTELLAEQASVTQFGMMFVARSPHTGWMLRTLLATTHIPLRQVCDTLSPDLMTRKLDLLVQTLTQDFGISSPRIAVAGLNPHSGEQGLLGHEEQDWLCDWVKDMGDRHSHIHLTGPVPPDTLWVAPGQAWFGTAPEPIAHDAYLALYHDQGLIPVKLMAFDCAVNTTIGLPFVRTSPDHGTAFDIAGAGVADASSMTMAVRVAIDLAHHRIEQIPSQAALQP